MAPRQLLAEDEGRCQHRAVWLLWVGRQALNVGAPAGNNQSRAGGALSMNVGGISKQMGLAPMQCVGFIPVPGDHLGESYWGMVGSTVDTNNEAEEETPELERGIQMGTALGGARSPRGPGGTWS